jgi:hypothetical protein
MMGLNIWCTCNICILLFYASIELYFLFFFPSIHPSIHPSVRPSLPPSLPSLELDLNMNVLCISDILGFPNVLGCTDGTFIRLQRPRNNEADFVNRKGYHSLNVQVMMMTGKIMCNMKTTHC